MADILPSGSMGSKNLPVPVSPALPSDMGGRAMSSPTPKVVDGLEPIIMSLDMITEQLDIIVSSSGGSSKDFSSMTVGDFEKILEKYLSKQVLSDVINEALTRQSPPAKESSLLVRQNVKSSEIASKEKAKSTGNFEDVFSQSSKKKSSSGGGGSLEGAYNKVVDVAHTATHSPLKLLNDLPGALFKALDKANENRKEKMEARKSSGSQASGEFAGGDFFGNFAVAGAGGSGGGAKPPGGVTSSVDDIQEEAAEVGIKADKSLYNTLEDPEGSKFGKFMGSSGDRGGGGAGRFAMIALIVGLVVLGIFLLKDLLGSLIDDVLVPLGKVVIDILVAIKDPIVKLVNAVVNFVCVVLGVIGDILVAIKPYLILMAEAICGIVVVVLNIVKEILVALEPLLIRMAEAICGIVCVVLEIIQGILEAIAPYIIKIAEFVGGILVRIFETISFLVDILTFPIRLIAKILEKIEPYLIRMAEFIFLKMAEWLERNEELLNKIFDFIGRSIASLLEGISLFLEGMAPHMKKIGDLVGGIIVRVLTSIDKVLGIINRVLGGLEKVLDGLGGLAGGIANAVRSVLPSRGDNPGSSASDPETQSRLDAIEELLAESRSNFSGPIDAQVEARLREAAVQEYERRERAQRSLDARITSSTNLEGLSELLGWVDEDGGTDSQLDVLKGIYGHTATIASILINEFNESATRIVASQVSDLVVTASGEAFTLAPGDAIFAIDTAALGTNAARAYSGVPDPSSYSSYNSPNSPHGNVTNTYVSSTNIDSNGMDPFSAFHPVGV